MASGLAAPSPAWLCLMPAVAWAKAAKAKEQSDRVDSMVNARDAALALLDGEDGGDPAKAQRQLEEVLETIAALEVELPEVKEKATSNLRAAPDAPRVAVIHHASSHKKRSPSLMSPRVRTRCCSVTCGAS